MAIAASVQPESARIVYAGSDFSHPFQLRFCKEGMDHAQNRPGSDLDGLVRVWPNGSGPEASRCARIIQPASGQCFPADPDRMRIGSDMFTGYSGRFYEIGNAFVVLPDYPPQSITS